MMPTDYLPASQTHLTFCIESLGISAQYRVRIPQSRKDTNRTIGMTSFSIGTNRTIGTDGPSELPSTQPGHMEK